MKKCFFALLALFTFCNAYTQSQNKSTYSVGINLLAYGQVPKVFSEIRSADSYKSAMFNGLIAKFNDNQISYRFLASRYFQNDYRFYNECATCELIIGKYTSYEFKMGFEKNLIYSKLQPFFGVDMGYKSVFFNGYTTDLKSKTGVISYNAESDKNGFLLYPFVGLKYTPLPHFTLSVESGFNLYGSIDKETKRYYDALNTVTVKNTGGWQFLTQPLGLVSIQYNFGSN